MGWNEEKEGKRGRGVCLTSLVSYTQRLKKRQETREERGTFWGADVRPSERVKGMLRASPFRVVRWVPKSNKEKGRTCGRFLSVQDSPTSSWGAGIKRKSLERPRIVCPSRFKGKNSTALIEVGGELAAARKRKKRKS